MHALLHRLVVGGLDRSMGFGVARDVELYGKHPVAQARVEARKMRGRMTMVDQIMGGI
jgi:hypothetical protein